VYYQQYVKNPQLRTSAFYPLHPQISSTKIIRILPVSASAHPHFTIGQLGQTGSLVDHLRVNYLSHRQSGAKEWLLCNAHAYHQSTYWSLCIIIKKNVLRPVDSGLLQNVQGHRVTPDRVSDRVYG